MTAQAEFGHGVGTVGIHGIPEHLSDIFFVICENTNRDLSQNRAGSPDSTACSLDPLVPLHALLKLGFCLFAFFQESCF